MTEPRGARCVPLGAEAASGDSTAASPAAPWSGALGGVCLGAHCPAPAGGPACGRCAVGSWDVTLAGQPGLLWVRVLSLCPPPAKPLASEKPPAFVPGASGLALEEWP